MLLERDTGGFITVKSGGCCTGRDFNMQAFSFGQMNVPGQRSMSLDAAVSMGHHADVPADYVFVDEHNRHKRLKGKAVI